MKNQFFIFVFFMGCLWVNIAFFPMMLASQNQISKPVDEGSDNVPETITETITAMTPQEQKEQDRIFVMMVPLDAGNYTESTIQAAWMEQSLGASLLSVSARIHGTNIRVPNLDNSELIPLPTFDELSQYDRVQLISLRRNTGLDGAILATLNGDEENTSLDILMVDFNRGTLFKRTKLQGRLDAHFLTEFEELTIRFCGELSRFYQALIVINTKPIDAEVYLDGNLVGKSPLYDLNVPEGSYTIEVKKEGFAPIQTSLTLREFERYEMVATLDRIQKREAQLRVNTIPQGATVFLNNKDCGKTPLSVIILSGTYSMRIEKEGKSPYHQKLEIEAGEMQSVDVPLLSPLANTLRNAPPGFYMDSFRFHIGYTGGRWVKVPDDHLKYLHFFDTSLLFRLWRYLDVGFFLAAGKSQASIPIDSKQFLPNTNQDLVYDSFRYGLDFRGIFFQWPRYLETYLGARIGLNKVEFYDYNSPDYFELDEWKDVLFTSDMFLGATLNPILWNTGAMGISLDFGFSYQSEAAFKKKQLNLFGAPTYVESDKMPLWNMFARIQMTMHFSLREHF